MAEILTIIKTSEKVLIWLYRENKSQQWLAEQFGVTRQSVSQKISNNLFSVSDIMNLRRLGCPL
jgi:DNA-binding CsgD family transcriptional regulator